MANPKFKIGDIVWFKRTNWNNETKIINGKISEIIISSYISGKKERNRIRYNIKYNNGQWANLGQKDITKSREILDKKVRNAKKSKHKATVKRAQKAIDKYEKQLILLNKQLEKAQNERD